MVDSLKDGFELPVIKDFDGDINNDRVVVASSENELRESAPEQSRTNGIFMEGTYGDMIDKTGSEGEL